MKAKHVPRAASAANTGIASGRRRVAVVTGTRAEYGLLRSTLNAIQKHPRLTLQLVVTGMHLLRRFGNTVRLIEADGWRIDAKVRMQKGNDEVVDQAAGLARGIDGMSRYFVREKTDVVVVLGDRIEALAGALGGFTTGCLVAHIHGGDVAPGDFDNTIRDTITRLAHVHFPATRAASERIAALGEEDSRVHVVGAPGLDELLPFVQRSRKLREPSGFALVVQHPCGRAPVEEGCVMEAVLDAVADAGLRRLILYPNTDRGHSGILAAIGRHRGTHAGEEVRVVPSLAREEYLKELFSAEVIVGNSSSGIIEAATAGTPAVNVGERQAGRERSGRFVFDAKESRSSVRAAIAKALRARPKPGEATVYGDGRAGERIASILGSLDLQALRRPKIVVQ